MSAALWKVVLVGPCMCGEGLCSKPETTVRERVKVVVLSNDRDAAIVVARMEADRIGSIRVNWKEAEVRLAMVLPARALVYEHRAL